MTQDYIYTSDRGDPYVVSTMETSHLINAIGHHMHQREVLESLRPMFFGSQHLGDRIEALGQVIKALATQLATRDLEVHEYLEPVEEDDDEDEVS